MPSLANAQVASIVAGNADFIERAKLVRKRLGGWMRQAVVIAACGLYALARSLAERDVLVMPLSPTQLRFVTHMDVGPQDLDRLVEACATLLT